jgi:hypothetical protein
MNLSPAQEVTGLILGGVTLIGVVLGIGKYFAKAEDRIGHLEQGDGLNVGLTRNTKCKPVFICPYTEDIKELRESLNEVRENVAELKGTIGGINSTVEFIGNYIRSANRKVFE